MPQKVICGSPMATICQICIFAGSKMSSFWGSKMPKFATTNYFAPNAPQSHLVVSHDHNLQNLHIWGGLMPILGVKNAKVAKKVFTPNASKSHSGVSYLGDQKSPFAKKKAFAPNASKKSYSEVSHDQNLQNLHIWGIKNTHFAGKGPVTLSRRPVGDHL